MEAMPDEKSDRALGTSREDRGGHQSVAECQVVALLGRKKGRSPGPCGSDPLPHYVLVTWIWSPLGLFLRCGSKIRWFDPHHAHL
jgi:hypothetical protein